MQIEINFPIETSRKFFEHLSKKTLYNKTNDKLERLKNEILIYKSMLEANNEDRDLGYIQLANQSLTNISNIFSNQYSDVVNLVDENAEFLKNNPLLALTEILGDYHSEKALKILKFTAEELNYTRSQMVLGSWLHYGNDEAGIKVDLIKAKRYYEMAASEDELAKATLEQEEFLF